MNGSDKCVLEIGLMRGGLLAAVLVLEERVRVKVVEESRRSRFIAHRPQFGRRRSGARAKDVMLMTRKVGRGYSEPELSKEGLYGRCILSAGAVGNRGCLCDST